MPTQAQARQKAKERVRVVKRVLRKADTKIEVLERRLNKLLERDRLITIESFQSFLENYDKFVAELRTFERVLTDVMIIFTMMG